MNNIEKIIKKIIAASKIKNVVPITEVKPSEKLFSGKVAFISGGSGGIGFAIAKVLLESDCKVIIAGTNKEKLNRCIKDINNINAKSFVLDYNNIENVDEIVAEVVEIFGKIDIFINSAGVHTENVNFWNINAKEYDRVMDINLRGAFFLARSVARYMVNNKIKGHILFVSSSRGSEPAWSPYGLSKCALNGMTKGLAKELISYGIVVNAIAPGSTATDLIGYEEGNSIYTSENCIGRFIMPNEVAEYVKLLVSDLGNVVVGETILISAGRGTIDIR